MSTPNLNLTTVPSNSTQPSVPVNDSLQALDVLVQMAVEDMDSTSPPTTTADDAGKAWIIPDDATGDWSGKSGQVAVCTAANLWQYLEPRVGWLVWVKDESRRTEFDGSAWVVPVSAVADGDKGDVVVSGSGLTWVLKNTGVVPGTYYNTNLVVGADGRIIAVTSGGGGMSNPMTTAGDMIVGGASGTPTRVAAGTNGYVLTMVSGAPAWAAISALTGWTLSTITASPNNTVNAARMLANVTSTNGDAVIQPKGTGANLAQLPGNTATGGNKRGARATDWQKSRSAATSVASGDDSFIGGGYDNTASGQYSSVDGGYSNTASGLAASAAGQNCVASGANSRATGNASNTRGIENLRSHGSGSNTQLDELVCVKTTSDNTATVLTSNGAGPGTDNQMVLPDNSSMTVWGYITARQSGGFTGTIGDSKSWKFEGLIKQISGTCSLEASITPSVVAASAGASAWSVAIVADNTNKCLKITVTGATDKNISWSAGINGLMA